MELGNEIEGGLVGLDRSLNIIQYGRTWNVIRLVKN